jgi:hypothetical protein
MTHVFSPVDRPVFAADLDGGDSPTSSHPLPAFHLMTGCRTLDPCAEPKTLDEPHLVHREGEPQ